MRSSVCRTFPDRLDKDPTHQDTRKNTNLLWDHLVHTTELVQGSCSFLKSFGFHISACIWASRSDSSFITLLTQWQFLYASKPTIINVSALLFHPEIGNAIVPVIHVLIDPTHVRVETVASHDAVICSHIYTDSRW